MPTNVIQIRDWKRKEEVRKLGQKAAAILAEVDPVALRHQDTSPSEYSAPPEDCA